MSGTWMRATFGTTPERPVEETVRDAVFVMICPRFAMPTDTCGRVYRSGTVVQSFGSEDR